MSDTLDDTDDDFDIYADLDDDHHNHNHNLNIGDTNCGQSSDDMNQTNDSLNGIESKPQNTFTVIKDITAADINTNHKSDHHVTNDFILSELTILEKSLNKTEDNNKSLLKQNEELRKQLENKDKQLLVLKTNISSLYKTAKAEIERKKTEINGLREELDSIIFRRLKRSDAKDDTKDDTNADQLNGDFGDKSCEQKVFCEKSTNTSDKEFKDYIHYYNRVHNNHKSTERSTKVVNKESNRSQRSRSRSLSHSRRRSPSRNRHRSRHGSNGDRDSKSYSAKRNEDNSRRNDSKSTNESKRHREKR